MTLNAPEANTAPYCWLMWLWTHFKLSSQPLLCILLYNWTQYFCIKRDEDSESLCSLPREGSASPSGSSIRMCWTERTQARMQKAGKKKKPEDKQVIMQDIFPRSSIFFLFCLCFITFRPLYPFTTVTVFFLKSVATAVSTWNLNATFFSHEIHLYLDVDDGIFFSMRWRTASHSLLISLFNQAKAGDLRMNPSTSESLRGWMWV